MPRDATALKTAASDFRFLPVRSRTSRRNAPSVGMNAVSATLPSARTPTGECGLALSTATTAAVRMSKSLELASKPFLSALSTATRDFVPSVWLLVEAAAGEVVTAAPAAGAVRTVVAPTARTAPAAAAAARRERRMVGSFARWGLVVAGPVVSTPSTPPLPPVPPRRMHGRAVDSHGRPSGRGPVPRDRRGADAARRTPVGQNGHDLDDG